MTNNFPSSMNVEELAREGAQLLVIYSLDPDAQRALIILVEHLAETAKPEEEVRS